MPMSIIIGSVPTKFYCCLALLLLFIVVYNMYILLYVNMYLLYELSQSHVIRLSFSDFNL